MHAASRPAVLAAAALSAAALSHACGGPSGPAGELRDLEAARERWEARGPASYAFTYELNCFCGGPGSAPVRITVTEGRVTGAYVPDEDRQVPEDELADHPTVGDLFRSVSEWLERDPVSARTVFDPTLGHPLDVFVDFRSNVIDEELGFRVRDLEALQRLEGS